LQLKAGAAYIKHLRGSENSYSRGAAWQADIAKALVWAKAPEGWRALASVFPDYTTTRWVSGQIAGEPGDGKRAGRGEALRLLQGSGDVP
jgi:DNA primase